MRRLLIITIALTGLAILAASARQDRTLSDPTDRTMSFDFPGGTVSEYVGAIRQQAPDTNIVVRLDATDIRVDPVSLARVSVASALELLVGEYEFGGASYKVQVDRLGGGGPFSQIYTVDARQSQPFAGQNDVQVRIYAIEDLLKGGVDENELMTVIDTTLTVLNSEGEGHDAELKFHEGTSVLIARATPPQLSAIEQILSQLRDSAGRRQAQEANELEQHRFQMMFEDAAARAEMFEHRFAEAEQRAVAAETRMALLEDENRRLRERVGQFEHEVLNYKQQLTQLEMMLAETERKLNEARQKKDDGG